MLSVSVKLPDGSKSLVKGESVSDLWDAVWGTVEPMVAGCDHHEAVTTGYVNTLLNTSGSGGVATTNCTLTTTGSTNLDWSGGSYTYPLWPWNPLDSYMPIFQKLPMELCSNPSSPPVDIYRDKERSLHYLWAVAGYNIDQISVEFEDGYLHLTLDKEESKKEAKDKVYLTRGIKYGKIENKYFVGDKYDTKKVTAKLKEGILEVIIPMKEEEKPSKVKIEKD